MKNSNYTLVILFIFNSCFINAQNFKISGQIIDINSNPIDLVEVKIGDANKTFTNLLGTYESNPTFKNHKNRKVKIFAKKDGYKPYSADIILTENTIISSKSIVLLKDWRKEEKDIDNRINKLKGEIEFLKQKGKRITSENEELIKENNFLVDQNQRIIERTGITIERYENNIKQMKDVIKKLNKESNLLDDKIIELQRDNKFKEKENFKLKQILKEQEELINKQEELKAEQENIIQEMRTITNIKLKSAKARYIDNNRILISFDFIKNDNSKPLHEKKLPLTIEIYTIGNNNHKVKLLYSKTGLNSIEDKLVENVYINVPNKLNYSSSSSFNKRGRKKTYQINFSFDNILVGAYTFKLKKKA